jgi:CheY-like chemotaxis protein
VLVVAGVTLMSFPTGRLPSRRWRPVVAVLAGVGVTLAVRVMLADDAVLFREGLARILTDVGFTVTGQAGDGPRLLALVRADPPDVAVIDLRMPPGYAAEGIDTAAAVREAAPQVGLLLLSQYVEVHHALRLMTEFDSGVGYLLKDRVSDLASFGADVCTWPSRRSRPM